jgi:hypothetical protein
LTLCFTEQPLEDIPMVQEVGRQQLVELLKHDGQNLRVTVIFPNALVVLSKSDHRTCSSVEKVKSGVTDGTRTRNNQNHNLGLYH